MNAKTKEYREKVANEFVKCLEDNPLQWKKNWQGSTMLPQNAVTGRKYNGTNKFFLRILMEKNHWEDPRFATFKQIQDAGWKLKKGSKGIQVEYWMPYDLKNHKAMTWGEYKILTDEEKKQICIKPKYSYVFQAKDIEGIPEMPEPEVHEVNPDEIIEKISRNMQVEIVNDGEDHAFYRLSEDKIHLPKPEYFNDTAAYNSVALHELSHASGAPHRLNRDLSGFFGSSSYAYEELIAEICSAFMGAELTQPVTEFEMENHKAYVQSWIQEIKDKPETLFRAIKEAEKCSNYLSYKAELLSEKEYQNLLTDPERTGSVETVIQDKKDVNQTIGQQESEILSNGKIQKEFLKAGFKPTKTLVGHMIQLNQLTGHECTVKDISKAYEARQKGNNNEINELVSAIAEECKTQEIMARAIEAPYV